MFIGVLGSLGSRSWSQTFPNGIQHSQRSCKGPVLPWPSKLLAAIDSLRLSGPRGGEGNSDTDSPSCFFWSVLFMTLSLATASHPGLQWFQSSIQLRTTGSSAKWAPSRGSWPFCLRWCMVLICMATWKIPLAPKWWVPSLTSSKLCWILFSFHDIFKVLVSKKKLYHFWSLSSVGYQILPATFLHPDPDTFYIFIQATGT